MKVVLIGVNHDYEVYLSDAAVAMGRAAEPNLDYKHAFQGILDREVESARPVAIVEESGSRNRIEREIASGYVKESVPQVVAHAHGLPHSFLPDLSDEDAAKLGLPSLRDAELSDEQKRLKHDERERRWVDAIDRLEARVPSDKPLIAVVGADHLSGLAAKLGDRVLASVDTVRELDYDPNE